MSLEAAVGSSTQSKTEMEIGFDAALVCYDGMVTIHRHVACRSSNVLNYMVSRDHSGAEVCKLDVSEYSKDIVDIYVRHAYSSGEEDIAYDKYGKLLSFCSCIEYAPLVEICYQIALHCSDPLYACHCFLATRNYQTEEWKMVTSHCYRLVVKKFGQFMTTPGFSQIDISLLMSILSDRKLKNVQQSNLMYALVRWLRYDFSNRDRYADDLFIHFDSSQLTQSDLKCLKTYKECSEVRIKELKSAKEDQSASEKSADINTNANVRTMGDNEVKSEIMTAGELMKKIIEARFSQKATTTDNQKVPSETTSDRIAFPFTPPHSSRRPTPYYTVKSHQPRHSTVQPVKSSIRTPDVDCAAAKKCVHFRADCLQSVGTSLYMRRIASEHVFHEAMPILNHAFSYADQDEYEDGDCSNQISDVTNEEKTNSSTLQLKRSPNWRNLETFFSSPITENYKTSHISCSDERSVNSDSGELQPKYTSANGEQMNDGNNTDYREVMRTSDNKHTFYREDDEGMIHGKDETKTSNENENYGEDSRKEYEGEDEVLYRGESIDETDDEIRRDSSSNGRSANSRCIDEPIDEDNLLNRFQKATDINRMPDNHCCKYE